MKQRCHSETDGPLSFPFSLGTVVTWFSTDQEGNQGHQVLNLPQCQVMTWMDKLQQSPSTMAVRKRQEKFIAPKAGECEVIADGM